MDLLFDTETTGFAPRGVTDPTDKRQPHCLQIALAHRIRSEGRIINAAKFILRPEGEWTPDAGAERIHGIDRNTVELCGIPASRGLSLFRIMAQLATRLVAFNIEYDWAILNALAFRSNVGLDVLPKLPRFCAMQAAAPLCKLPSSEAMLKSGRTGYKNPKLIEAYRCLVDPAGFDNAHDAFADLSAMNAILNKLEAVDGASRE